MPGHFVEAVFYAEKSMYLSEGVPWPEHVNFPDNSALLALLEGSRRRDGSGLAAGLAAPSETPLETVLSPVY